MIITNCLIERERMGNQPEIVRGTYYKRLSDKQDLWIAGGNKGKDRIKGKLLYDGYINLSREELARDYRPAKRFSYDLSRGRF